MGAAESFCQPRLESCCADCHFDERWSQFTENSEYQNGSEHKRANPPVKPCEDYVGVVPNKPSTTPWQDSAWSNPPASGLPKPAAAPQLPINNHCGRKGTREAEELAGIAEKQADAEARSGRTFLRRGFFAPRFASPERVKRAVEALAHAMP